MTTIVPTISGPKRPQDKVLLTDASTSFKKSFSEVTGKKIFQFQKLKIKNIQLKMDLF